MLAADLNLEKKTLVDGRLLVVFIYKDDVDRARELADAFAQGRSGSAEPIRGLPIVTELSSDPTLAAYGSRIPAGVFLCQSPEATALRGIVQVGIAKSLIVYSPFEGHVESGVTGGLTVEAQVRPFVNQKTLAASRISLKEFFLRVAKVHP
jgi:hypothetical protein